MEVKGSRHPTAKEVGEVTWVHPAADHFDGPGLDMLAPHLDRHEFSTGSVIIEQGGGCQLPLLPPLGGVRGPRR